MLRWSAEETGGRIDFAAMVDPAQDPGVAGGRELVALARAALGSEIDAAPTLAVAERIGGSAAVRAAAVAGAFELYNRIVDATGLPVGRVQRQAMADVIDTLSLNEFPHAGHGV